MSLTNDGTGRLGNAACTSAATRTEDAIELTDMREHPEVRTDQLAADSAHESDSPRVGNGPEREDGVANEDDSIDLQGLALLLTLHSSV